MKDIQINSYYIYFILDEFELPFYVGKGKGNRYKAHFNSSNLTKNKNDKNKKILDILEKTGDLPRVKIIEQNLSESDAFIKEKKYINEYKLIKNGGILTNITNGGNGASYKKSEEHKQKIRNKLLGGKFTCDRKEKIRKALIKYNKNPENREKNRLSQIGTKRPSLLGKPRDEKTKNKISNSLKGRKLSIERIEELSIPITIQNMLTGEILKFKSIKDANLHVGITNIAGFYMVISTNQIYVNRTWKIIEIDGLPFVKNITTNRQKFLKFKNINTNQEKIFSSINNAILFGIKSAQFLENGMVLQSRDGWRFVERIS